MSLDCMHRPHNVDKLNKSLSSFNKSSSQLRHSNEGWAMNNDFPPWRIGPQDVNGCALVLRGMIHMMERAPPRPQSASLALP